MKHTTLLFALAVAATVAAALPEGSQTIVGNIRVQCLSPTLVRAELKGPLGFEDRKTFLAVDRAWDGVPIRSVTRSGGVATITTDHYLVLMPDESQPRPGACDVGRTRSALRNGVRVEDYPSGIPDVTMAQCCERCGALGICSAWEWSPSTNVCFLLQSGNGIVPAADRVLGFAHETGWIEVRSVDGSAVLYRTESLDQPPGLLDFPAPADLTPVFALRDSPRFVPPEWGATPMPDSYSGPCRDTNGFDLRNPSPDLYMFLTSNGYSAFRKEFLRLTGPVPALPYWIFGTWFSWWHAYTQKSAMDEVNRFREHNISLDVFGLDVDWRDLNQEYNYVINEKLFPDMRGFIDWLHKQNLHTFFNDHPEAGKPGDVPRKQMAPDEVNFRWNGLTSMLKLGLDFWWYDSNWYPGRIIPGAAGLDNKIWVQSIYRDVTTRFFNENKPDMLPFSLHMFTSTHPAHHRYPIWWTGDILTEAFEENVKFMVDGGVQLKPYVHPDCTGHIGTDTDEVYSRWVQFCSMGNIIRIHSNKLFYRQPWAYSNRTEAITKHFVDMRYTLIPSLIAAGKRASEEGAPIVKRCDLEWPGLKDSRRSDQYLLVEDILVAPIVPFPRGNNSRLVWVPPGTWEDAWSGKQLAGPQLISVTMPVEQIPMYYRRGSFLICAPTAQTIAEQDWSRLYIDVFPGDRSAGTVTKKLYDIKLPGEPLVQEITMTQGDDSALHFRFESAPGATNSGRRAWTVRVHAVPGTRMADYPAFAALDGKPTNVGGVRMVRGSSGSALPFAGTTVEFELPAVNVGTAHELKITW